MCIVHASKPECTLELVVLVLLLVYHVCSASACVHALAVLVCNVHVSCPMRVHWLGYYPWLAAASTWPVCACIGHVGIDVQCARLWA
eukprot:1161568-Pelagomonas_calceolata.AAC.9